MLHFAWPDAVHARHKNEKGRKKESRNGERVWEKKWAYTFSYAKKSIDRLKQPHIQDRKKWNNSNRKPDKQSFFLLSGCCFFYSNSVICLCMYTLWFLNILFIAYSKLSSCKKMPQFYLSLKQLFHRFVMQCTVWSCVVCNVIHLMYSLMSGHNNSLFILFWRERMRDAEKNAFITFPIIKTHQHTHSEKERKKNEQTSNGNENVDQPATNELILTFGSE